MFYSMSKTISFIGFRFNTEYMIIMDKMKKHSFHNKHSNASRQKHETQQKTRNLVPKLTIFKLFYTLCSSIRRRYSWTKLSTLVIKVVDSSRNFLTITGPVHCNQFWAGKVLEANASTVFPNNKLEETTKWYWFSGFTLAKGFHTKFLLLDLIYIKSL